MKFVNVAIAIIHHAGRILICRRRKNDSFADLWEFPGGKIERQESPEQCVKREIQEELGIQVEPISPFPVIEHTYPEVAVRLNPFLCRLIHGDPQPLASQRLEWVSTLDLRTYAFPAANKELIEQIIDRISSPATCAQAASLASAQKYPG